MASGYSGETQCSTYIVQRLYWSTSETSSGHNVYVELQMRRTNSYGGATYSYPSNSYISINGDRYDWSWTYAGYPSIPAYDTNWHTFASRTVHVSHSAYASIYIEGGNYNMGSYLNGATGTWVGLDAIITSPSGLSLSSISRGITSFTGTVSISGWGKGGSSSQRYLEMSVCSSNNINNRRWKAIYTSSTSKSITVDNSSPSGNITIQPNTRYYLTMYATNGAASTGNSSFYEYTTRADAPTISVGATTSSTATINWSTTADGGKYTKKIEYSLDNGSTWTQGATTSGSAAASGSFTISGLTAGAEYTILSRVTTDAGSTAGNSITVKIRNRFYGSVNNQTKAIKKLYGSVGGQTKEIVKLYGSVGGVTKRIY